MKIFGTLLHTVTLTVLISLLCNPSGDVSATTRSSNRHGEGHAHTERLPTTTADYPRVKMRLLDVLTG